MQPQFFPWLFDDRIAWEKSLADPRYSYELPIDCFMTLYGLERTANIAGPQGFALPSYAPITLTPALPLSPPVFPIAPPLAMPAIAAIPLQVEPLAAAVPNIPKEESKIEEGVLSQEEIDALLSGM